jgi:hypothetical protein
VAPGQLRIVTEPARVGRLAADLQFAVEADAATGRGAGENVEGGVCQWLVAPLLLLALAVVVVPPVLLLLLDEVSLLLLLALVVVTLVVMPFGQAVRRGGEGDRGAGEKRDECAKTSHGV